MKYLLDTNTVSYLVESPSRSQKRSDEKTRGEVIIERIRQVGYENVFINTVVVGEVYAGLYSKVSMEERRRKNIEENLQLWPILPMTSETGKIYGEIKSRLSREGMILEDNDLWIAATAMTHHAVLVSNDRKLQRIENLFWENWVE